MRQSERAQWFAAYSGLRSLLDETLQGHAMERSEWAEERQRMLDAILSGNTGEFLARQNAAKPRPMPLAEVPKEAREGPRHALGF